MIFKRLPIRNISGMVKYCGDADSVAHGATSKVTLNNGKYRFANAHDYRIINGHKYYAKKIRDKYYLPNKNGIYKRNVSITGINMFTGSSADVVHQFKNTLNRYPSKHRKNDGLQLIISNPPTLNPYSRTNQRVFQKILYKVAHKLCNGSNRHLQAIIYEQADNGLDAENKPKLHGHILICNADTFSGKSIPSKVRNINNIKNIINESVNNVDSNKFSKIKINIPNKYKSNTTLFKINKVVNNVLSDDKIGTKSKFRNKLKQNNIKVIFHNKKIYYYDNKGNKIPLTRNGKVIKTAKGKTKYKYYVRRGISFKIKKKNKKGFKTFKGSKVSKLYPNCNVNHILKVIHKHYIKYKQSKNSRINHHNKDNIYLPNKASNVVPNLRLPIKHLFYNELNEIYPQLILTNDNNKTLKNLAIKHAPKPNKREHNMMNHCINHIINSISRRIYNYKIRLFRKLKESAKSVDKWLIKHHHHFIRKWIHDRFIKLNDTLSNLMNTPKSRKLASESESLGNRIILTNADVSVHDIKNYQFDSKYPNDFIRFVRNHHISRSNIIKNDWDMYKRGTLNIGSSRGIGVHRV